MFKLKNKIYNKIITVKQAMIQAVIFEGVKATVQKTKFKFLTVAVLAAFTILLAGCPNGGANTNQSGPGDVDPNEVAATVNGSSIKLVEVERAIKQQAQGQESKLSQLELANARLKILEQLIQQEVLFQKAEAEKTIPTDEEVSAAFNKQKTESGLSAEAFDKKMKEIGETEDSARDKIKRGLAIQKLVDKIAGKVEPPKDSEIEAFYNGNKEAFVKKRGVKLAAIVIDPKKTGEGDPTVDEASTSLRLKEIGQQLNQGSDFATIAREKSEDPSRVRGGDLGYLSEEQLKQNFPQLAAGFMNANTKIGQVVGPVNIAGRLFIFKLQERIEKEENLTLESPGVRKQITDSLVNARKSLLSASYAAIAMNDAKIENYLARKVVENPNELSGARPASTGKEDKKAANTNTESNSKSNANAESKKDDKADDKKGDEKKADDKKEEAKSDSNSNAKAGDEKK